MIATGIKNVKIQLDRIIVPVKKVSKVSGMIVLVCLQIFVFLDLFFFEIINTYLLIIFIYKRYR